VKKVELGTTVLQMRKITNEDKQSAGKSERKATLQDLVVDGRITLN
jgi:hypothetical protein